MSNKPNITGYEKLISVIGSLLHESKSRIVLEINRSIITTYWHIGKYIVEYEQSGKERAEYGTELLKRLSKDLTKSFGRGFSYRNLQKYKKFFTLFPIVPTVSAQFKNQKKQTLSANSKDTKLQTLPAKSELSKVQSVIVKLSWSHFIRPLSVKIWNTSCTY